MSEEPVVPGVSGEQTLPGKNMSMATAEVLRDRAESLAAEAETHELDDQMGILLFRLGDEWYAINVQDVREIDQEYLRTPIPCVPDFVLGVVNIRGEILSVTDLARMMRIGAVDALGGIPPAVVVHNDDCVTAIVVDEIGDIVDVSVDSVEPPLSTIDKFQAEFIAGSIYVNGSLVGLLNVARVLQPIVAVS
ncbi:MAG: chemotaxis protein CheW [Actinomycetota bacterium]|jgi:purine-binding chemotaxis protein CheW|nr:chemotaxis protein CheW [Actinomycetota bacterium]